MYVIGITGPTGAGKTTALRVLADMGGQVIDCDAVYHRLLESDGALLGRIEAAFPGVVKDWSLDRKALGARVYGDPEGLKRLTELTWPAVRREVERRLKNRRHPSTGLEAGPPPLQAGEVSAARTVISRSMGAMSVSTGPFLLCFSTTSEGLAKRAWIAPTLSLRGPEGRGNPFPPSPVACCLLPVASSLAGNDGRPMTAPTSGSGDW